MPTSPRPLVAYHLLLANLYPSRHTTVTHLPGFTLYPFFFSMPEPVGDTPDSNDKISPEARRKSQSRLIAIAVSGSTNNALLTSIAPLFLLSLGASPFLIGLVATSSHLQKMGRVVGLQFMHRTGKAGLFFWGKLCSLPAGIALALLAFQGGAGVWAAWIGLAVFTVRGMVQQVGNTAWWPLVQDNTSRGAVGSFLARMRLQQRLLELVLPLLVGWYLGSQPIAHDFALPFALALFSTFAGALLTRGIAEQLQPPPTEGLLRRLRQVAAEPPMRAYALFIMARTAVLSATFPLWVVALTDWGLPVSYFVWMTPVQALGYMAGLHGWGRMVDRHGSRGMLTITLILQAALAPAWLFLPAGLPWITLWAGVVYFLWGALDGGHQMGQSRAMLDAVSTDYQAEGFAIAIYASALGGFVGGIGGGACFQWADALAGPRGPLFYLATAQLAFVATWLLSTRLAGYCEQTPVRRLFRTLPA